MSCLGIHNKLGHLLKIYGATVKKVGGVIKSDLCMFSEILCSKFYNYVISTYTHNLAMIFFQDNSEIASDFTRLAQKQTVACQKSNLHYLQLASGHLK